MRKFLAIVVCKLGRFVGKLVGKGSSMPGKFALKICPDILRRVQLPAPYHRRHRLQRKDLHCGDDRHGAAGAAGRTSFTTPRAPTRWRALPP